jgi:hypothetical protein
MFDYRLEGQVATLEGKSPGGRTPESGGFRYLITIAGDKAATGQNGQAPRPKPDSPE